MCKFSKLITLSGGLMLLVCMFTACDKNDAPEMSAETPEQISFDSEFPSLADVKKCVEGKTFICDNDGNGHTKETYVDSQGREFTTDEFWHYAGLLGYVFGLNGLAFDGDNLRVAQSVIYTPGYIMSGGWTYDESTGLLSVKRSIYTKEYVIEAVAEDYIVVRSEFGILPTGMYELANGIEFTGEFNRDEGSYAKATYVAVTEEEAKAFWERLPEGE